MRITKKSTVGGFFFGMSWSMVLSLRRLLLASHDLTHKEYMGEVLEGTLRRFWSG